MARIQLGGIITGLKGSINGWTFHSNQSGLICRTRSGTNKSGTAKQFIARQQVGYYNTLWQGLTLVEQLNWLNFASVHERVSAFGDITSLSGANWHQSINFNRASFGLSYIASPPFYSTPTAVPVYTVSLTPFGLSINLGGGSAPAGEGLLIWTTNCLTRVSTSLRSSFRATAIINPTDYNTTVITSEWENTHGLSWPDVAGAGRFKVGVMIQSVKLSSGIASPGEIVISSYDFDTFGIGFGSIGSTFIVG